MSALQTPSSRKSVKGEGLPSDPTLPVVLLSVLILLWGRMLLPLLLVVHGPSDSFLWSPGKSRDKKEEVSFMVEMFGEEGQGQSVFRALGCGTPRSGCFRSSVVLNPAGGARTHQLAGPQGTGVGQFPRQQTDSLSESPVLGNHSLVAQIYSKIWLLKDRRSMGVR